MGYTHGINWTDNAIKDGIFEVMNHYKISRMPSRNEIVDYFKDNRLASKLSRIGYYKTAQKYGLRIKEGDTTLGKTIEKAAKYKLEILGYQVESMQQNFPYDLLVNNKIKIDVKASNLYCGAKGSFYTFSHEKSCFTCDFYIFYALDKGKITDKIYVVPACLFSRNTQFSIGENHSKYEVFRDRFDLISVYLEQLENLERAI